MNFNLNPTTALIITGQLRINDNENPIDKINYHLNYFKHDEAFVFIWDYEYEKYKTQLDKIKANLIIGKSEQSKLDELTLQQAIFQFRKSFVHKLKPNENFNYEKEKNIVENWFVHYYLMQETFKQVNNKHQTYIKTRHDMIYLDEFESKEIFDFLDQPTTSIATPFGGDAEGFGLGDLFVIYNKPAMNKMKTFYDDLITNIKEQKAPTNGEAVLRFIFKNYHQANIYRFNFPCTTQRMLKDNYICHPKLNFNTVLDNTQVPNLINITHKNIYQDLNLLNIKKM